MNTRYISEHTLHTLHTLQAEEEKLHEILLEAGFDWRQPGCSMCLAMNADKRGDGERCEPGVPT